MCRKQREISSRAPPLPLLVLVGIAVAFETSRNRVANFRPAVFVDRMELRSFTRTAAVRYEIMNRNLLIPWRYLLAGRD